ncbi:hypothetical protein [Stenotrophomonas sp. CFBP 13718]|uniref:hypothetical protein n=1 Tax=Stenotrophomonas sp. CFBP 13718 TaxID=2775304 RepID=UPI0017808355|nr:hypothetical protein [Stenotrophomonas sp. CFBP 13718]MBD8698180.1 hypothetical protein [Stenotrophomonas sp. CFBP 13718]
MAAVATKFLFSAAMVLVPACQAEQEVAVLSERFNVCAALPPGVSFQPQEPGPDFDLGNIKVNDSAAEIQIGGHPRFSHGAVKKGITAADGFKLLGKERSDGKDKFLFAYERGDEAGPIYVMVMAPELHAFEQVLNGNALLVVCG